MQEIICLRCGFVWFRQRARVEEFCSSCRSRSAKTVRAKGVGPCVPWHGSFDEYDNPIQGDDYWLPGFRLCGNSDCVEPTHIVGVKG